MVKVGFIVEGDAEVRVFESNDFKNTLKKFGIKSVGIFNAQGKSNLTSFQNEIDSFFKILKDKKADKIIVLIDKEEDPCITLTKENLNYKNEVFLKIVVVKAIESWFLADSKALSKLFDIQNYCFENPENIEGNPFDALKNEFLTHTKRGISKTRNMHTKKMLNNGFSISNAALHPNCHSAKYFLSKLKEINETK